MFDYKSFGADRKERIRGPKGHCGLARFGFSNGKVSRLILPIEMVEKIQKELRTLSFDYAMDKDGNFYLFAGSAVRITKTRGCDGTKMISVMCIADIAAKIYSPNKIKYLDYEITYDANGIPAAVFMPIGA